MVPATIEALLSLTKSLEDVGKELGTLIAHATETPDVANRVVRYLEVVQTAVYALGRERQLIIEEVDKCNVGNPQQVRLCEHGYTNTCTKTTVAKISLKLLRASRGPLTSSRA